MVSALTEFEDDRLMGTGAKKFYNDYMVSADPTVSRSM